MARRLSLVVRSSAARACRSCACAEEIVDRGDYEDNAEQNKKTVTSTHCRTPDRRTAPALECGSNSAAEMKSKTAARRSAIRFGASGSKRTIRCITGALLK